MFYYLQCVRHLLLPSPPLVPLFMILVHRKEIPWLRNLPLRLLLRLGLEEGDYPCSLVNRRFRPPVYSGICDTITALVCVSNSVILYYHVTTRKPSAQIYDISTAPIISTKIQLQNDKLHVRSVRHIPHSSQTTILSHLNKPLWLVMYTFHPSIVSWQNLVLDWFIGYQMTPSRYLVLFYCLVPKSSKWCNSEWRILVSGKNCLAIKRIKPVKPGWSGCMCVWQGSGVKVGVDAKLGSRVWFGDRDIVYATYCCRISNVLHTNFHKSMDSKFTLKLATK